MSFVSLFRRLFGGRGSARPRSAPRFTPRLMPLEDRSLPSVTAGLPVRPVYGPWREDQLAAATRGPITGPLAEPVALGVRAPEGASARGALAVHNVPFTIRGGGLAPQGLPLTLFTPAPHDATGTATLLGQYSAQGMFQLTSFTGPLGGTFNSSQPVIFTDSNGDQLAFHYGRPDFGASRPGTFRLLPQGDGTVVARFVAEFTPVPSASTGPYVNVTGGSFVMVATTAPFVLGSTTPTPYTWAGKGMLQVTT